MGTGGGPVGNNWSKQGYIRPSAALTDGMFKWVKPSGAISNTHCGGGGAIGLNVVDISGDSIRNFAIHSAINFTNAHGSVVRDCTFWGIKGRAIYFGANTENNAIERIDTSRCGDASLPLIDCSAAGYTHIRNSELEVNYSTYVSVASNHVVRLIDVGFEHDTPTVGANHTFINGQGAVQAMFCEFRRNNTTHVTLASSGSSLYGCEFAADSALTAPSLIVSGSQCRVTGCRFVGSGTQVATQITLSGSHNTLADLYVQDGGNIAISGHSNRLCDSTIFALATTQTACVKATADDCIIEGNIVDGNATTAAKGIQSTGAIRITVSGNVVKNLNNAAGIDISSTGVVEGNSVASLNGGIPYVFAIASGAKACNNTGFTRTATATGNDTSSSATLNAESGVITTPSLTVAAGGQHVFTLTNNFIHADSVISVNVSRGSATQGEATVVESDLGSGAWGLMFENTGAAAYNGTYKISFQVIN
jgi:hypothetical protein